MSQEIEQWGRHLPYKDLTQDWSLVLPPNSAKVQNDPLLLMSMAPQPQDTMRDQSAGRAVWPCTPIWFRALLEGIISKQSQEKVLSTTGCEEKTKARL